MNHLIGGVHFTYTFHQRNFVHHPKTTDQHQFTAQQYGQVPGKKSNTKGTPKQHNKTAQPKADKYPTSHFSLCNCYVL